MRAAELTRTGLAVRVLSAAGFLSSGGFLAKFALALSAQIGASTLM